MTVALAGLALTTTLGVLTSPVRESPPFERWSPLEVARFEAGLCLVGKAFPQVARMVGTKTTREVRRGMGGRAAGGALRSATFLRACRRHHAQCAQSSFLHPLQLSL